MIRFNFSRAIYPDIYSTSWLCVLSLAPLLRWLLSAGSSRVAEMLFEYPVTKPLRIRFFSIIFLFFATIWAVFVTLLNLAAVGYEYIPTTSQEFNSTKRLWYEKFVRSTGSWYAPSSWTCDGLQIKFNEGLIRFIQIY